MNDLRQQLAARVIDPLFWDVVKRYPVRRRLSEFRAAQWDDPKAFEARRDRRLSALLRHAVVRVPFYRERLRGLSPDSIDRDPLAALNAFPILERADLHDHFDDLTCEMGRGTSHQGSSGGSTGTPVRFLQDRAYRTAATAGERLGFEWAGIRFGDRIVRLWAARRDLPSGRRWVRGRFGNLLFNRVVLDAFRMSDRAMADYIREINRFRPVCVEGYADALYELATFSRRSGAALASPLSVVASATTLFPHMRREISNAFGVPVFDRYGSREVGIIASECDRHEGLHVVGECGIVEIVDRDGRAVDDGQEGEVLVTNLWNYTMPFIRYRIGDRAIRGESRCGCGRPYPILRRILGRSESCIVKPDGGVILPMFFSRLIGVEYNDGAIRKFQVVQEALDRIVIRVVPFEGTAERALSGRDEITKHILGEMGAPCSIEFVVENDIKPTRTGKHLYTVSKVSRE